MTEGLPKMTRVKCEDLADKALEKLYPSTSFEYAMMYAAACCFESDPASRSVSDEDKVNLLCGMVTICRDVAKGKTWKLNNNGGN